MYPLFPSGTQTGFPNHAEVVALHHFQLRVGGNDGIERRIDSVDGATRPLGMKPRDAECEDEDNANQLFHVTPQNVSRNQACGRLVACLF